MKKMNADNISIGEVVVTVLALVGMIVYLINISEAMRDLMLGLTNVGGELIPIVAWNNVRNEILLLSILSVYMIVGLLGILTPPNDSPQASVAAVLVPALSIFVEILAVANSFANRFDRILLKRYPVKVVATPSVPIVLADADVQITGRRTPE
jgi:hypothetical protein